MNQYNSILGLKVETLNYFAHDKDGDSRIAAVRILLKPHTEELKACDLTNEFSQIPYYVYHFQACFSITHCSFFSSEYYFLFFFF